MKLGLVLLLVVAAAAGGGWYWYQSRADGAEVRYRVVGDGFLRHMVRTLAGTLIFAGRGRLDSRSIPRILEARDRALAGPVAPARGLALERVFYGEGS